MQPEAPKEPLRSPRSRGASRTRSAFSPTRRTDIHRATFEALTDEEGSRRCLAANVLCRTPPDGWAATMYRKVCWNPVKNRYICPDGTDYMNPASQVVVLSSSRMSRTATSTALG